MARIGASVGRGGVNRRTDTTTIQNLLNNHIQVLPSRQRLDPDGKVGSKTIGAIEAFQRRVMHMGSPDGRVDPHGQTLGALNRPSQGTPPFHYPTGPQELLTEIARPYIGATEAQGNRIGSNPRMREIFEADRLMQNGRTDGYAWCTSFVSLCVQKLIRQSMFFAQVTPPRECGVTRFRTRWAPAQHCRIFKPNDPDHQPHKGDILVYTFSHIGIVDQVETTKVWAIEGNTNAAGSREGTMVRRKDRLYSIIRCFIRLPIPTSYDVANGVCVN